MARKVILSAAGFFLLITYIEFAPPWTRDLRFLAPIRYAFLAAFFIGLGSLAFESDDHEAQRTTPFYLAKLTLVVAGLLTAFAFIALAISYVTADLVAADTLGAHLT